MRLKIAFIGLLTGYLISSYFQLAFPPTWFWVFCSLGIVSISVLYYYWRRLNEDILD